MEHGTFARCCLSLCVACLGCTESQVRHSVIRTGCGDVNYVALSGDGTALIYVASDKSIRVCDLATLKDVLVLKGETGVVSSLAMARDGSIVGTADSSETLIVWRADHKKRVALKTKGSRLALSGDGKLVAVGHGTAISVRDIASGNELAAFEGHACKISAVLFSRDGAHLISATDNSPKQLGPKNEIKIWSLETKREVGAFGKHTAGVTCIAFVMDGKRLASGSWDTTVRIWEVASGKELLTYRGHKHGVTSVAISPDDRYVVSGGEYGEVLLWELRTGRLLSRLAGHTRKITSLVFTPDGKELISASADGTILLRQVDVQK